MIFSRFKWNASTILELDTPVEGFIYFRSSRFNLLTGFPETYDLKLFLKELERIRIQDNQKNAKVFHFYYELGLILAGLGHTVGEDEPLAIVIEYKRSRKKGLPSTKLKSIPLKSLERPNWSEYKEAFNAVQEHLLNGDCYQVNLTYPFDFETQDFHDPRDISDFFFSRPGLSAFAHATYCGEEMILSNSPECLFQYRDGELFTMPIKGTIAQGKDWKKSWREMKNDPKQEGELSMITDLLRNDLNRLEFPRTKVRRTRAPLLVPGLLHQYSLLSVELSHPLSLLKTLESIFPGGSITGAPKKKVMEIIQGVERYQRRIYCGSTLLCYGDRKVASINIRTASISVGERLWRYGAGGGITLLSKPVQEFQEMEAKVASFLTLLNVPGYSLKKM